MLLLQSGYYEFSAVLNKTRPAPLVKHQQVQAHKNKAWEQDLRQIYRSLCLIIKAKLEYVESGNAIFEHEFMANITDPVTGKTMGEMVTPMIEKRYHGIDTKPTLFISGPTK